MQQRIAVSGMFVCFVFLLAGCGGGGGGGGVAVSEAPVASSASYTVSGRIVAPYGADSQFAGRLIEEADGLELDGIPLSGATVTLSGAGTSTTADSMGNFTLTGAPGGQNLVLTATKGGLVLYKGLPPLSANKTVNVNFQTTTAYLYYQNAADKMPSGATVEWLEDAASRGSTRLRSAAGKFEELAQQYGTGQTTTPPHQHPDFTSLIAYTDDTIPPYLQSLTFSPSTITAGQTLTVTAVVFDTSSLSSSMKFVLQNKADETTNTSLSLGETARIITIDEAPAVSTNGNTHTITWTTTVPATCPPGEYVVNELQIPDDESNFVTYTGLQGKELQSTWYTYKSMNTLSVAAGISDTTAPQLVSATLSGSSISSATGSITLTVVARDSQNALTDMLVWLEEPSGKGADGDSHTFTTADFDPVTGNYTYNVVYNGSDFSRSGTGTYSVRDIYIRDEAGNTLHSEPSLSIKASVPQTTGESSGITVDSIVISRQSSSSPVRVSVIASNANSPARFLVSGELMAEDSGAYVYLNESNFSTELTYDAATGKWSGTADAHINDFVSGKTITLRAVTFSDSSGRYLRYYCSSSTECDSLNIPKLTIPANTRADSTAPALTSFSISPSSVTRGQNLSVSLAVSENGSGLKDVHIGFSCSACSTGGSYQTRINRFTYEGNSVWHASVSLPFNEQLAPGTWKVSSVRPTDFADNYVSYYSSELTTQFSVPESFTVQ